MGLQHRGQLLNLLGILLRVHAIDGRQTLRSEQVAHRLVRGKGCLFDQRLREVAVRFVTLLGFAACIEAELLLARLEAHRALLVAQVLLQQRPLAEVLEGFAQELHLERRIRQHPVQQVLHILVGVATHAADHRLGHRGGRALALLVKDHQHRVRQTIPSTNQRTQVVRQLLGQHRHHLIRQIDAGGARQGLIVERRAFAHIVRHIGDVHAYFVGIVRQELDRDGIVVVLRIGSVDGVDQLTTQIESALLVLVAGIRRQLAHFAQHIARKDCAHAKGSEHTHLFALDILVALWTVFHATKGRRTTTNALARATAYQGFGLRCVLGPLGKIT